MIPRTQRVITTSNVTPPADPSPIVKCDDDFALLSCTVATCI